MDEIDLRLTQSFKICESSACRSLIHDISFRKENKMREELEDCVSWLMNLKNNGSTLFRYSKSAKLNFSRLKAILDFKCEKMQYDSTYLDRRRITEEAVFASRPLVGSSRKRSAGETINSTPMLVRFRSPPEIPRMNWLPTCKITMTNLTVLIQTNSLLGVF